MNRKLYMAYHENGGNESFQIKGGAMLTIKATSDPSQQHNMLLLVSSHSDSTRATTMRKRVLRDTRPRAYGLDSFNQHIEREVAPTVRLPGGGDNVSRALVVG